MPFPRPPRRIVISVEAHGLSQPRSLLRGLFTALPSCSVARSDQSRALPWILRWPAVWEFRKGVLKRLLPPAVFLVSCVRTGAFLNSPAASLLAGIASSLRFARAIVCRGCYAPSDCMTHPAERPITKSESARVSRNFKRTVPAGDRTYFYYVFCFVVFAFLRIENP